MRRGGTAFLHLLKDAAVVNSNLYGEHGEFPLSLDSLMEGCDFYSSQHDSGGDIFALMLTAFLETVPYFVYKAFKETLTSSSNQIAHGINDTYLSPTEQINTADTRHPIAKTVGITGNVVGGLARTAIYGGGLFGLSSFGVNHAAKAFKNCINFICDSNLSTQSNKEYLDKPRNTPATVIKHANLVRVTNGLGYTITAACGVLGLTAHSMHTMGRGLNAVSQIAFDDDLFTVNNRAYVPYTKEWFAQAGLFGLAGIALGTAVIVLTKTIVLTARLLGMSKYSGDTIALALKRCTNFVFGDAYDAENDPDHLAIEAHSQKSPQTLEDRADRTWFGINRIINAFAYSVSFTCGVLGFTTHSMQTLYRGINIVSETAFGKTTFEIYPDEQLAFENVKLGSKEWFARAGLLGLANIAIGTLAIGFAKTVILSARLLGFSAYSADTISLALKHAMNFIAGTDYKIDAEINAINQHESKSSQTLEDRVDRTWFGVNRLINCFAYSVSFACAVLGFTTHSMQTMRRSLNAVHQANFGNDVFAVQIKNYARASKEWFAKAGLLGLVGIALGTVIIEFKKIAVLLGRFVGISEYSAHTMALAFKRCANFILNHNYDTTPNKKFIQNHKENTSQTLEDRADRSWIGINRLINCFSYSVSLACGILGLTAQSLYRMRRGINKVNQTAFGRDIFIIQTQDDTTDPQSRLAEVGFLGLSGLVIGTITIGFSKALVLTARFFGLSKYSAATIVLTFKECANFVLGTDYFSPEKEEIYISQHKAIKTPNLENKADRNPVGINQLINSFIYCTTFTCSILGLTAHSLGAMAHAINAINQRVFGGDIFTIDETTKKAYQSVKPGSKEWIARAGLLGLTGIAIGTLAISFAKIAVLTARLLGISEYSGNTMALAFKRCSNFVFGTRYNLQHETDSIQSHLNKTAQTLENRADRNWIGINRLINSFAYSVSFACGVLGFTTHSMQAMRYSVNVMHNTACNRDFFVVTNEEKEIFANANPGAQVWLARAGLLGLAGIAIGAVSIGFNKTSLLTGRLLGISDYSKHTVEFAYKNCANFVCGSHYDTSEHETAIANHLTKSPQTLEDRADRSWIGINHVINSFAYSVTFACGVLGLTTHSMKTLRRGLHAVNHAAFGQHNLPVDTAATPNTAKKPSLKERLAEAGLLGLAGIALGTVSIGLAKIIVLTARFLGFSEYSGHTIAIAFKRCSNFVFGTTFNSESNLQAIQKHKDKKSQTVENRFDRSWLGINRVISHFVYALSAILGLIGLTAAYYHSTAKTIKNTKNIFANDKNQISTDKHDAFLQNMAQQNTFTKLTSEYNLLRTAERVVKYTLWGSAMAVAFCLRRVWKLTLGNFIGNACGTDGTFRSTRFNLSNISTDAISDPVEKINQRFRDLLWCLEPSGELPEKQENSASNYEKAIADSKKRNLQDNIKWSCIYEIRKCASVFSLNSIPEKVILHFAATFKEYIREQKINNTYRTDSLAQTFFGSKQCIDTKQYIKTHYEKEKDKQTVDEVVAAIQADLLKISP